MIEALSLLGLLAALLLVPCVVFVLSLARPWIRPGSSSERGFESALVLCGAWAGTFALRAGVGPAPVQELSALALLPWALALGALGGGFLGRILRRAREDAQRPLRLRH